jgi:hypothetical protein
MPAKRSAADRASRRIHPAHEPQANQTAFERRPGQASSHRRANAMSGAIARPYSSLPGDCRRPVSPRLAHGKPKAPTKRPMVHSHADSRRLFAIPSHRRHPERPDAWWWRTGAGAGDGPPPVRPYTGQQIVSRDSLQWPAHINAAAALEQTLRHGARELRERPRDIGAIDAPQSRCP